MRTYGHDRQAGWPTAAALACAAAVGIAALMAVPTRAQAQGVPAFPGPVVPQHYFGAAIDPRTRQLLQRIRRAEKSLSLAGEQVTILYSDRGRPPEQSEQTILFDTAQGYTCQYHLPKRLAGEEIVSRADGWWHFIPKRHLLIVGTPRPRRIGAQIGPALRALRAGTAQATILGEDTVAGHAVQVVLIAATASPPTPTAKLWIDPASGAQLRTEVYDTQGQLRSVSYFTQVSYDPVFPAGAFDPPVVPPGTTTVMQQPPVKLNRLPTDAEAGFHVLTPASMPPGYVFQSASVFHYTGGNSQAVSLRYQDNLSVLSLFERVTPNVNPRAFGASSPRAGTVIVHRGGIELVAIGSLANGDLLNLLNSMR